MFVVILRILLTLSAHAPEGYSSHLVCRSVTLPFSHLLTLDLSDRRSTRGSTRSFSTFSLVFRKTGYMATPKASDIW